MNDFEAHRLTPPPRRDGTSWLVIISVTVLIVVWAMQEVAATFSYGPTPDPALTLVISGLVGAIATQSLKR